MKGPEGRADQLTSPGDGSMFARGGSNHRRSVRLPQTDGWNLQAAIGAYYDFESPNISVPSMSFVEDVTIGEGESIPPDTQFIKTWRIQNSGAEAWPPGVCLKYVGGDQFGHVNMVMVRSLEPQEIADVSVQMCSPSRAGMYQGQWRMCTATGLYYGAGHTNRQKTQFEETEQHQNKSQFWQEWLRVRALGRCGTGGGCGQEEAAGSGRHSAPSLAAAALSTRPGCTAPPPGLGVQRLRYLPERGLSPPWPQAPLELRAKETLSRLWHEQEPGAPGAVRGGRGSSGCGGCRGSSTREHNAGAETHQRERCERPTIFPVFNFGLA
ncbi:PREDICTED: uncharacterized protein LOC103605616 [Galeopterus variegatus]|uniref:Uncharacterized protein LOC103605616 n=1 Tax=Galeopterus variegatus TaxID=482537 RepID=A0ABM0S6G7_GALVR|nr:PREDICTED: uncharacterized protein LOC103605616 [Galeopterus variegatus]